MSQHNEGARTAISLLAMHVGEPTVARHHVEDNSAAFELEAEVQFTQTRLAHSFPKLRLIVFAIQHKKTTASGTTDFASNCTVPLRQLIPCVKLRIAYSAG